jgi:hypothetical protein
LASSVFRNFARWTAKNAIAGKSSYTVDADRLDERSRHSFEGEPLSLPESVFCALVFLRGQEKFSPQLISGCQSPRGSERPHPRLPLVEAGHHPAAQVVIKFNAEIAALNPRIAARNLRGYKRMNKRQKQLCQQAKAWLQSQLSVFGTGCCQMAKTLFPWKQLEYSRSRTNKLKKDLMKLNENTRNTSKNWQSQSILERREKDKIAGREAFLAFRRHLL